MKKDLKIKTAVELARILPKLRKARKKIITTNGGFDLLHVGHVRFLKRAKAYGDVLIVALNTDQSIQKRKGPSRPVITLKHRQEMLAALPFVDYVSSFSQNTPEKWLTHVKPDLHVKDDGYKLAEIAERTVVERMGGRVILLPYTKETSTTKIIERIKQ